MEYTERDEVRDSEQRAANASKIAMLLLEAHKPLLDISNSLTRARLTALGQIQATLPASAALGFLDGIEAQLETARAALRKAQSLGA